MSQMISLKIEFILILLISIEFSITEILSNLNYLRVVPFFLYLRTFIILYINHNFLKLKILLDILVLIRNPVRVFPRKFFNAASGAVTRADCAMGRGSHGF